MGSSGEEVGVWGILAIIGAMLCYGSYFVPVKKYEIHDGIVYQWYQCSGIMLAGMACALARNDWTLTQGNSVSGFYVAPEGVLSGLMFQVANFIATVSVKSFGLGNYYTVHQVTNLGVTFMVGVFGPDFGIPARPPSHVAIAALGFAFVLLGMMPVMFMEKEKATPGPEAAGQDEGHPQTREASDASARGAEEDIDRLARLFAPAAPEQTTVLAPADDSGRARLPMAVDAVQASAVESAQFGGAHSSSFSGGSLGPAVSSTSQREVQVSFGRVRPTPVSIPHYRGYNAQTWDGTLGRPRLGQVTREAVEPSTPWSCLGNTGLVVKEAPDVPEDEDGGACVLSELLLQHEETASSALWRWLRGFFLSLLAGALYASMYVPLLPWKERLRRAGVHAEGYDSFFSMCIGLYLASTAYLLCGGAWKKYRGQRMEKSVMRPALLSGVIYAVASQCFLYAMMILPYAVGYALGVGGGLAVSLLWGTLVFGEASSRYNRRCVVCSFAGVSVGILLLGVSA